MKNIISELNHKLETALFNIEILFKSWTSVLGKKKLFFYIGGAMKTATSHKTRLWKLESQQYNFNKVQKNPDQSGSVFFQGQVNYYVFQHRRRIKIRQNKSEAFLF